MRLVGYLLWGLFVAAQASELEDKCYDCMNSVVEVQKACQSCSVALNRVMLESQPNDLERFVGSIRQSALEGCQKASRGSKACQVYLLLCGGGCDQALVNEITEFAQSESVYPSGSIL